MLSQGVKLQVFELYRVKYIVIKEFIEIVYYGGLEYRPAKLLNDSLRLFMTKV